jgi:hypothetical protein
VDVENIRARGHGIRIRFLPGGVPDEGCHPLVRQGQFQLLESLAEDILLP